MNDSYLHELLDGYGVPCRVPRAHSGGALEDASDRERLDLVLLQWRNTRAVLAESHMDPDDPAGGILQLRRTVAEIQAGMCPPQPVRWTPAHWSAAAQWLALVALAGCVAGAWWG